MQYPTSAIPRSASVLRRPNQTNPGRLIARLMALVALFGVGGGCPQNLPPEAEWLDPAETTGTVSETSGVEGDGGPLGDDPLYVSDLAAATVQGQPVTLTLSAEAPSGISPEAGGQLFLSIVSAPYKGFVGPPEPIALDTLSAVYTPPDDFAGECYFTYVLYDETRSSNVGTVSITVYPRIYFTVESADGPGDLTVHTYAYTLGGHSLPDGTYTWSFDGEEDSGPMATHWERWHTFASGSLQAVTLSVTLAGLSAPLGCVKSPQISGWVADGSGAPIAGVEIAASDVRAVITDNDGQYRLPVPHLWSGTVKASRPDYNFDPPSRVYVNLTEDVAEQNFTTGGGQSPDQTFVTISGYVRDIDGIGMTGVTLSASNGGGSYSTVSDGHYELTVPHDWSGTVTPTHPGYTFSPPSRSYSNVIADDPDEGYQGTANPVNGSPVVYDQADVTPEDTKKVLTLSGSDPDSDDLTFEIVSGPSHGVLAEMDNSPTDYATVMYTPDRNFNGDDSFTFSAHDGHGGVSAVARFTITAYPLNDAPVIEQADPATLTVGEGSQPDDPANQLALSATDVDASPNSLVWTIFTPASHGTAQITSGSPSSSGGTVIVSYGPNPGYIGPDSFVVCVDDNQGGTDTITVNVSVGGAPIASAGPDQDVGLGAVVLLDGSASVDHLGGTNLTYLWEQTSGPSVTLENANTEFARFNAPDGGIDDTFELAFRLTVTDVVTTVQDIDTVDVSVALNKQSILNTFHRALERLWEVRVDFDVNGETLSGFASYAAADGGEGFWGDECGSPCDAPLWDFQGRQGLAGALYTYVNAYAATGNQEYLRRAQALGDGLLSVQDALGGGWFQDSAWIDGSWQNVGVWGTWGDRRHTPAGMQDLLTLDDSTSQSCALALLRLYEAGGGEVYLQGAQQFGDVLTDLPLVEYEGVFPYANGGIPQVLPLERALAADFNGNQDPRSPDGPYMAHKTNNDHTTSGTIIVLMELYRVTGELRYLEAVRLNVDYLLGRHAAYGHRGWAQQYHFLTDEIAWGRHKEPPAYVTCENRIVDAILLWHQRETDPTRKQAIESCIQAYLEWLRDDVEPYGWDVHNRKIVWRYYNHDPIAAPINEVTFADDYEIFFGASNYGNAGSGQPYYGVWDASWIYKILDANGQLDISLAAAYLNGTPNVPIGVGSASWSNSYTTQDPEGGWPQAITVNGQPRIRIATDETANRVAGLLYKFDEMSEALTDSDGDRYTDIEENIAGTDPHDSASHP